MKKTLNGPGIRVEIDTNECNAKDPGAGTPAMVYVGRESATFWCALDTGEVGDGVDLTKTQSAWLASVEDRVNDLVNAGYDADRDECQC